MESTLIKITDRLQEKFNKGYLKDFVNKVDEEGKQSYHIVYVEDKRLHCLHFDDCGNLRSHTSGYVDK